MLDSFIKDVACGDDQHLTTVAKNHDLACLVALLGVPQTESMSDRAIGLSRRGESQGLPFLRVTAEQLINCFALLLHTPHMLSAAQPQTPLHAAI